MIVASHRFNNDLRYRDGEHIAQTAFTPTYILDPVREALGGVIELDPCTTPDNPVGARQWIAPPANGLVDPWRAASIFVNPPYGKAREPWVLKCIDASRWACVVLLIPAHPDTRIFQRAMHTASAACFIKGRVKFGIPRSNGRQVAASHPSVLVGWNVDLEACRHLGVIVRATP